MERIERLAASDSEMPEGLSMHDQLLFLSLRSLYNDFRDGKINRERAKREKNNIIVAYRDLANDRAIVDQHLKIRKRLSKNIGDIYKCGCPHCKKLIDIFNGIDRTDIPDDIKELHAWNEKLRDMIKDLTERNAELSTLLEKKGELK